MKRKYLKRGYGMGRVEEGLFEELFEQLMNPSVTVHLEEKMA